MTDTEVAHLQGFNQRTVVVDDISVAGTHEPFVEHVSFTAPHGEVTVVPTDPGIPQVALALAIGGRVELMRGRIRVGAGSDLADLQLRTRLVDVADVTAPEDTIAVRAVVEEELALAEKPAGRAAVAAFLAAHDLSDRATRPWEQLPAGVRTSLLLELGALHPMVRVLVLAGPERHGGDHTVWLETCRRLAATGLAVIVLTTAATAASLPADLPSADLPSADDTARDTAYDTADDTAGDTAHDPAGDPADAPDVEADPAADADEPNLPKEPSA